MITLIALHYDCVNETYFPERFRVLQMNMTMSQAIKEMQKRGVVRRLSWDANQGDCLIDDATYLESYGPYTRKEYRPKKLRPVDIHHYNAHDGTTIGLTLSDINAMDWISIEYY